MSHAISYVDNSGGILAHYKMLAAIKTLAEANGWTTLRYDTVSANRELILKGPGYSGTEDIYVGIATYQDAGADYYNLLAAAFTGYLAGNSFDTQPGAVLSGVPAHNSRIDYWLTINPQRIALTMKVGTPVYEHLYLGKMLPYARPTQFPYPVVCGGMLNGAAATRFSDTSHSMPYKGARTNMRLRLNSGAWSQPECWPWNNTFLAGAGSGGQTRQRDTADNYPGMPIVLSDANGIYGELDGVRFISGFNNATENTIGAGPDWVVLQDVSRTGFTDYIALRMDA